MTVIIDDKIIVKNIVEVKFFFKPFKKMPIYFVSPKRIIKKKIFLL